MYIYIYKILSLYPMFLQIYEILFCNIHFMANYSYVILCLFIFVSVWLGSVCMSMSLLLSPITIGICRKKSTRLTAVMGGLVIALGCLFTSFANQFHQMYFSFGLMIGNNRQTHFTHCRPAYTVAIFPNV